MNAASTTAAALVHSPASSMEFARSKSHIFFNRSVSPRLVASLQMYSWSIKTLKLVGDVCIALQRLAIISSLNLGSNASRSDSSASWRNCCSWPSSWICTNSETISWMVSFLLISGNFILRRSKLESFLWAEPSGNCSRINSSALASNLAANSGGSPGATFIISVTVFSLKDRMLVFKCWFGLSTSACGLPRSKLWGKKCLSEALRVIEFVSCLDGDFSLSNQSLPIRIRRKSQKQPNNWTQLNVN